MLPLSPVEPTCLSIDARDWKSEYCLFTTFKTDQVERRPEIRLAQNSENILNGNILTIECEIPSLKLVVSLLPDTSAEEERLLYLTQLNKHCREATLRESSKASQSSI